MRSEQSSRDCRSLARRGFPVPLTPKEWSAVVVGRWNRAILTPSGIAKRLFHLEEGTPVAVFVAIDALDPPQVKHEGFSVVAGWDRLIVQPETCDFEGLQKAMAIACRAMENLPETPVIAAGMNVKYNSSEALEALQQITRHEWWDAQLSDRRYEIAGRSLIRALKWSEGQINFSVAEEPTGAFLVQLNFHRESTSVDDLKKWVSTPISEINDQVKQVLFDCMQIKPEDIEHAPGTGEG